MSAIWTEADELRLKWLRSRGEVNGLEAARRNKIASFFPETGPLRRELYPKHMEFFEASASYRETAFIAANRCITPWTPIEMGHATRLPGEILGEPSFGVRSWDGGSRCTKQASGVFLKGIEPAFRLLLANGQAFDCSCKHRVLTREGWLSFGQLLSPANGLHCWHKQSGYQANYGTAYRRHDPQPLDVRDSDRGQLPLPPDAQRLRRFQSLIADGAEHRFQYSRAFQGDGPPPSPYDHQRLADLFSRFLDPAPYIAGLWPTQLLLALHQFARESVPERQAPVSRGPVDLCSWANQSHGLRNGGGSPRKSRPTFALSPSLESLQTSGSEFLHSCLPGQVFVPSDLLEFVGGQSIVAVIPLGYQPIVDFTVKDTHCYESQGVIHHNSGKSEAGSYATTLHLTGDYPDWWKGKRFDHAIRAWAAGTTNEKTRETVQEKLCGSLEREPDDDPQKAVGLGTGMIPGDKIVNVEYHPGIRSSIKNVWVKHKSGRNSQLTFKSYEQGREAFEGSSVEIAWLDEESPQDVYLECLVRTMTTNGIVYLTFTPLNGLTDVVLLFMPGGDVPPVQDKGRFVVQAEWDDAPHLTEKAKTELYRTLPPHQRDARSKGRPQLGSGAIYPVPETDISVQPFDIPRHWPRVYGLDVGTCTAAIWGAQDPDTETWYMYREYYREGEEPAVHAAAIKGAGSWIPGVIDPAARGRSQIDGRRLLEMYKDLGLDVEPSNNAVESGLFEVWNAMTAGKFKVFSTLTRWFQEFRLYRRDEKGRIVKKFDHLQDAGRYLFLSGRDRAKVQPAPTKVYAESAAFKGERGWMV